VPVLTTDSLILAHQLPIPELVKIDVQGFEQDVLKGGDLLFVVTEAFILETSLYDSGHMACMRLPTLPLFTKLLLSWRSAAMCSMMSLASCAAHTMVLLDKSMYVSRARMETFELRTSSTLHGSRDRTAVRVHFPYGAGRSGRRTTGRSGRCVPPCCGARAVSGRRAKPTVGSRSGSCFMVAAGEAALRGSPPIALLVAPQAGLNDYGERLPFVLHRAHF
jgi:hypothetical protein